MSEEKTNKLILELQKRGLVVIPLDDACELSQENARLEERVSGLILDKQTLCKQVALMRLVIDTIGSEKNHKLHLDAESKHWASLSDDLVEIIECIDLCGDTHGE